MSHLCVMPVIRSSDPQYEVYRTVTRTESTRRDPLGSTTSLMRSAAPDIHIRTSTDTALTAHSGGTCSFTRREMAHVMQEPFSRERDSQARNMERVTRYTHIIKFLAALHVRGGSFRQTQSRTSTRPRRRSQAHHSSRRTVARPGHPTTSASS